MSSVRAAAVATPPVHICTSRSSGTGAPSTRQRGLPLNNLGSRRLDANLPWGQILGGDSMVNKVFLIGNLAAEPDVKATPKGTYVANIRLATHTYVGKGDEGKAKEETEFHRLVAFGRLAEFAGQYLHKGRAGCAEGRLCTSTWEERAGGKGFRTEGIPDR